jgi:BlaR1 peptidase M56
VQVDEAFIPKVVGLIWPRILIPVSALSGLSAAELELILIHELAHLRRHDMWVNLVQRVFEAVLFFNPAAWYLSRRIGILREFCCDEMTCRTIAPSRAQARTEYARALLRVVELACHAAGQKVGAPDHDELVALAASGRRSSQLRQRVASLFGEPAPDPLLMSAGGMLTVVGLVLCLLFCPVPLRVRANSAAVVSEGSAIRRPDGDNERGGTKNAVAHSAEAAAPLSATDSIEAASYRPGSVHGRPLVGAQNPPPKSPEILERDFISADLGSLGQEMRLLAAELQHVDKLVKRSVPEDAALRSAMGRLAARSTVLLEDEKRLAALGRTVPTRAPSDGSVQPRK